MKKIKKIFIIIEIVFIISFLYFFHTYSLNQKYISPFKQIIWEKVINPIQIDKNLKNKYFFIPKYVYLINKKWENAGSTNMFWVINLYNVKNEKEVLYHELTHYNIYKRYTNNKTFRKLFDNLKIKLRKFNKVYNKNINNQKLNKEDILFLEYIKDNYYFIDLWLYQKNINKSNDLFNKIINKLNILPQNYTANNCITQEIIAYQVNYHFVNYLKVNKTLYLQENNQKITCKYISSKYLQNICYTLDNINSYIYKNYQKSF